jgi:hypothetical protein
MFSCPTCKSDCKKLIARGDKGGKLRCESCYEIKYVAPTYLHQRAEGHKGDRGYTIAKDMMIDRRVLSPDRKTTIDRVTGRETQY